MLGTGMAERGMCEPELRRPRCCPDFCTRERKTVFSCFHKLSCLSSHTRLTTSHWSSPASKDQPSSTTNIQKYSDLLTSIWAFSGLKRGSSNAIRRQSCKKKKVKTKRLLSSRLLRARTRIMPKVVAINKGPQGTEEMRGPTAGAAGAQGGWQGHLGGHGLQPPLPQAAAPLLPHSHSLPPSALDWSLLSTHGQEDQQPASPTPASGSSQHLRPAPSPPAQERGQLGPAHCAEPGHGPWATGHRAQSRGDRAQDTGQKNTGHTTQATGHWPACGAVRPKSSARPSPGCSSSVQGEAERGRNGEHLTPRPGLEIGTPRSKPTPSTSPH
nr:uncharacterized protein LOC116278529 [Vicugna pacos]